MSPSSITPSALLDLASSPPNNPKERKAIHDAARALVLATESPSDTETRIQNSFTVLPMVRVANNLDLFNIIASRLEPWQVNDLADKTGVEPNLLHRLLRYLAIQGLISEVNVATYGPSRITPHVQPSGFKAGVIHNTNLVATSMVAFPEWLQRNNYRAPTGGVDCAFQMAKGTELDAFGYLAAHPKQAGASFEYMQWQNIRNQSWMDGSVQVAEGFRLTEQEIQDGRVLLVDVGGGAGHQCFNFRKAFPERKGKLVVQDTEIMIPMIDTKEAEKIDLSAEVYDFFTEQPVKGAKVYYMRTVLHDWNDEKAIAILKRLAEALAEDSMVVIDEIVVPAKGASEKQVLYDLAMLTAMGSAERSEEQWRYVLEAAGLKLREISIFDEEFGSGLVVAVKA